MTTTAQDIAAQAKRIEDEKTKMISIMKESRSTYEKQRDEAKVLLAESEAQLKQMDEQIRKMAA